MNRKKERRYHPTPIQIYKITTNINTNYTHKHSHMYRVSAPEREKKVCGLAARQKVKLGRILDQVHCDIITEREAGTYYYLPLY